MEISLHTPEGIIIIDTETVTNEVLATLGISPEAFKGLIPRDPLAEIDKLKEANITLMDKIDKLKVV